MNEDVPPTVITPLSVITSPDVTAKFCPTDTVPRFTAVVPLSNVTSPVPVVVKLTAPVNALVSRVIELFATSVVKEDVPLTVNAALSVIAAPDVATRLPFTVPCNPKARRTVIDRHITIRSQGTKRHIARHGIRGRVQGNRFVIDIRRE